MKPNILIFGKTGAGKTSLIQAMTKKGTVPDDAIGHCQPTTAGFNVYKTDIINFIDCEGIEPGKQTIEEYIKFIMSEVVKRRDSNNIEQLVHCFGTALMLLAGEFKRRI